MNDYIQHKNIYQSLSNNFLELINTDKIIPRPKLFFNSLENKIEISVSIEISSFKVE